MIKRLARSITISFLTLVSRAVLRRYRPKVVMVTGSVGKTSTKDAVAAVLAARFLVRKSEKSFNSEFGVPFTILGVDNPWSNPVAWLSVVRSAFALLLLPNHYPNLLVLEVGADKPGDLASILKIATPDVVVVTRLPEIPVHVEAYPSPEAVREEEFSPAYALAPAAPLIVAAEDLYALEMAARVPAHLTTYGIDRDAGVRLSDIGFYEEEGRTLGMRAVVHAEGEEGELLIKGSVGETQLLPAAAALATAAALGISLTEALTTLVSYEPPAGRGRVFRGKNGSTIIDDSYNASPAAVEEALKTLASFPTTGRHIAVLGDMLELGRYSVMEHERIGARVAKGVDIFITVGIRAKGFATAALATGMSHEYIFSYDDSRAAALALPTLIEPGDVLLVKGSQSIRTERIIEALLADPADRAHLVRQEPQWQRR